jgi:UPF0271 protein
MSLRVIKPGLSCSLQDGGRKGWLAMGVPPSGALDPTLRAIANRLCGNQDEATVLEMIGMGPALEVLADRLRIALAGDVSLHIDERPAASWQSHTLVKGQTLAVGAIARQRAAYLAIQGGFAAPSIMGSRSTYARAGLGLVLSEGLSLSANESGPIEGPERFLPAPAFPPPDRLRVIPGPEFDAFTQDAQRVFFETVWQIGHLSDRMGLRLQGPRLSHSHGADIPTEGVVMGAIQVPGDGQPILLLNDHQTTGGYAKIACVISADLAKAGRLAVGQKVRFAAVGWAEARTALLAAQADLEKLLSSIRPEASVDIERLLSANLVSGAVDALSKDEPC